MGKVRQMWIFIVKFARNKFYKRYPICHYLLQIKL